MDGSAPPRDFGDSPPPASTSDVADVAGGLGVVADALPAAIAVLDRRGTIVAVNATWHRHALANGLRLARNGVGASYLAVCDAAAPREPTAEAASRAIREAIAGRDEESQLLYPLAGPGRAERWFLMRVTAFGEGEGRRVVIVHSDVSELRATEQALHELTARLLVAQDEERRRVARELHDGTAQTLVALSLELSRLAEALTGELHAPVSSCVALCEQSLQELRTMAFLLHPPALEREGLPEALRLLADGFGRRAGIVVSLDTSGAPAERLAADVELALFRIAQEALTNVHRHSSSRTVRISLSDRLGEVWLVVADDGAPTELAVDHAGGVGIASMRERVRVLGGRLELSSARGGTVITAVIPRGS